MVGMAIDDTYCLKIKQMICFQGTYLRANIPISVFNTIYPVYISSRYLNDIYYHSARHGRYNSHKNLISMRRIDEIVILNV